MTVRKTATTKEIGMALVWETERARTKENQKGTDSAQRKEMQKEID